MIENIIIIVVLVCIIGGIVFYLHKCKKRGDTCIGCPYAKQCGGNCSGSCQDNTSTENPEDTDE